MTINDKIYAEIEKTIQKRKKKKPNLSEMAILEELIANYEKERQKAFDKGEKAKIKEVCSYLVILTDKLILEKKVMFQSIARKHEAVKKLEQKAIKEGKDLDPKTKIKIKNIKNEFATKSQEIFNLSEKLRKYRFEAEYGKEQRKVIKTVREDLQNIITETKTVGDELKNIDSLLESVNDEELGISSELSDSFNNDTIDFLDDDELLAMAAEDKNEDNGFDDLLGQINGDDYDTESKNKRRIIKE